MNFKIENTNVYGVEEAVLASGNSFRTEFRELSDLNEKDWKRGIKLGAVDPGTGHDSFLNGITVTMNITAPLYWWKQAQRYHWLEFVSSESTMHCVMKFDIKKQCVENTDKIILERMNQLIANYNEYPSEEKWRTIIASLPCGFCLGATLITNYRQLKTICKQRKGHRLKEWETFIDWCLTLPHFTELTGIEKE
jgi:hypothetical protein